MRKYLCCPNMYCKARVEKKRKSRSSDKLGLAFFLASGTGAGRGTRGTRGAGKTLPTPPVKTQTHESDSTWDGSPSRSRGPNLRVMRKQIDSKQKASDNRNMPDTLNIGTR